MWIALFSQTGSELQLVTDQIKKYPDYVFTTNKDYAGRVFGPTLATYKTPAEIEDWLIKHLDFMDVLTLHGYLYVLSPEVCNLPGTKVNGHPGLITKYPELKGKDPQEKVYRNLSRYAEVGCVLHEVVAEVDSGRIISEGSTPYRAALLDKSVLYCTLLDISVRLWVDYLKEVVWYRI